VDITGAHNIFCRPLSSFQARNIGHVSFIAQDRFHAGASLAGSVFLPEAVCAATAETCHIMLSDTFFSAYACVPEERSGHSHASVTMPINGFSLILMPKYIYDYASFYQLPCWLFFETAFRYVRIISRHAYFARTMIRRAFRAR